MARTQGINLRAQIGQGALRRQGLLEAAPHARCIVAPALGALAESGHGLGGQGRRIEVRPVFERGRQGNDLIAGRLQARPRRGLGLVVGEDRKRPACQARIFPVGVDGLLRSRQLGERCRRTRVFGLVGGQGTPLRQRLGGLARSQRGRLSDALGLCMSLARAIARRARPCRHRAGILRAGIEQGGLIGPRDTLPGTAIVEHIVIAEGPIQGTHALEGTDGTHAPLLDAALRRRGGLGQRLREIRVDLRVENVAQDLLARLGGGREELGELALGEHDGLEELVLIQADDRRDLVAHVARPRRDGLDRAPAVGSVRILHDARERRLRVALRFLTRRGVRGGAAHAVDARGHLEDQVHFRGVRVRNVVGT